MGQEKYSSQKPTVNAQNFTSKTCKNFRKTPKPLPTKDPETCPPSPSWPSGPPSEPPHHDQLRPRGSPLEPGPNQLGHLLAYLSKTHSPIAFSGHLWRRVAMWNRCFRTTLPLPLHCSPRCSPSLAVATLGPLKDKTILDEDQAWNDIDSFLLSAFLK